MSRPDHLPGWDQEAVDEEVEWLNAVERALDGDPEHLIALAEQLREQAPRGRPRTTDFARLYEAARQVDSRRQATTDDAAIQAVADELGIYREVLRNYWNGKMDRSARRAGFPRPPRTRRVSDK